MKQREKLPTRENSSNFNIVPDSITKVGTTLENLKAAINGETGASAKYAAFALAADEQGYPQIARLFRATSAAEQIHIGLETAVVKESEPDFEKPEMPDSESYSTDINLIEGALGEIYETSDMYPSFIQKAVDENNSRAIQVFSRAKLAESTHAENYLKAYNDIDEPDDDHFYLCPICGYIHKGTEGIERCPICFTAFDKFHEF